MSDTNPLASDMSGISKTFFQKLNRILYKSDIRYCELCNSSLISTLFGYFQHHLVPRSTLSAARVENVSKHRTRRLVVKNISVIRHTQLSTDILHPTFYSCLKCHSSDQGERHCVFKKNIFSINSLQYTNMTMRLSCGILHR